MGGCGNEGFPTGEFPPEFPPWRNVCSDARAEAARRAAPLLQAADHMERAMNQDVIEGKWKQIRGEVKKWWGQLTDDDLDTVAGNKDKLIGKLQERYGYAREKAEEEVEHRLREYKAAQKDFVQPAGSKGTR
jgi:uncharacterized protein YjbJ (UPF0337 family)